MQFRGDALKGALDLADQCPGRGHEDREANLLRDDALDQPLHDDEGLARRGWSRRRYPFIVAQIVPKSPLEEVGDDRPRGLLLTSQWKLGLPGGAKEDCLVELPPGFMERFADS